jgi:hypothetical protein
MPANGGADYGQGWHASVNGQTTGPYDWATVTGLVRDEGAKKVVLWHSSLGSWTSAAQLPAFRRRRSKPLIAMVAAAVVVALALALGLGLGLKHDDGVPVADTPMVADYTEDIPGEIWDTVVMPDEEAAVSGGQAEITLPQGAVAEPASVTLTQFAGPYGDYGFGQATVSAQVDLSEGQGVYAVSQVFDVGPAGTQFEKPVKVLIHYDESALPESTSESDVVLMYFNGAEWAPLPTRVDRDENTVSVALESFDGSILVATAVGLTAGFVINRAITWWYGPEAVKSDPISDKKAHKYVTPKDPEVSDWAQRAVLCTRRDITAYNVDRDPNTAVGLSDPQAVGMLVQSGADLSLGYRDESGQIVWLADRYNATDKWAGWQMPVDYFGKRGLFGDCTDHANGTASVLRNLGYQTKGVFGYFKQGGAWTPHAWAEVVLDGKPFIVTSEGDLYPASADGLNSCNYKRPDPSDPRYAMWDENGQEPYVESWWTLIPTTTTTTLGTEVTLIPGTIDFEQVSAPPDHVLDGYVTASNPSDPSDHRVYATYTRSYSSDSGPRFSIGVWEYSVVDGRAISTNAFPVYSWDVGTATSREAVFSEASAAIAQRMADQGLVAGDP